MVLSSNIAAPLKQKPLLPKILPISFKKEEIFRQLARISRSTRGIVILLCDLKLARVIMSEAQRLNMVGGHFIWIWADTSTNNEFFDQVHPDEMESEIDDNLDLISLVDREKQLQQQQQQKHQHVPQSVGRETQSMGGYPDEMMIDTSKQHFEPKNEYETIESLDNTNFHLYEDLLERRLDFDSEFESTNRGLGGSHNLSHELPLGPDGAYNPFQHSIVSQVGYGKRMIPGSSQLTDINVQDKIETQDEHEDDEANLDSMLGLNDNLDNLKVRTRRNPFLPFMTTYNNNNGNSNKYNLNNNNNNDDVNSDENIMDPMNANDINKIKRVNLLNQLDISSSHVLFHNFQDFPIGLLTIRPIKMLTDRHFIRSAVRLFATTWAKLERNSNSNLYGSREDEKPYRFKKVRNKRDDEGRDVHMKSGMQEQTSTMSSINLNKNNNKPSTGTSHVNTYVNINSIWEPEQIVTKTKQQTSGLSEKNEKIEKSNKFTTSTTTTTTTTRYNNVNTNTVDDNDAIDIAMKSKRFDSSWWPSIGRGTTTNNNKQQKQKQSSSGDDRIKNRGTPQYKGGCFGAPTRGDIKRAELFARYVQIHFSNLILSVVYVVRLCDSIFY